MAKLLPIIIVLVGLGVGIGAGVFLRPAPHVAEDCVAADNGSEADGHDTAMPECDPADMAEEHDIPDDDHSSEVDPASVQYVKLSNQFVVPVVEDNAVSAMVVISLSIETVPAMVDTVFKLEPKLRDALLRVMFLHANSGGFEGQFTSRESMKDLRGSLLEAAREVIGSTVTNVLVTDILRQDI